MEVKWLMQLEGGSFSLTASNGPDISMCAGWPSTLLHYIMTCWIAGKGARDSCSALKNVQINAESPCMNLLKFQDRNSAREHTHKHFIMSVRPPPFISSLMSCSSGLERLGTQITWAQEGTSPHNAFFCLLNQWSKRHGLSFPSARCQLNYL